MEKLAYLLMGPPGAVGGDVGGALLDAVPEMFRRGARSVQVNVADPALGHPFGVEPDPGGEEILAAAFFWVDAAEGSRVASVLPDPAGSGARWHGWLVCESVPLPDRTHLPGPDGRLVGFAQLMALRRPERLTWGEWRRLWQQIHTSVAVNVQGSFRHVQNVVFRVLTEEAPPFAAVVEECFPLEAARDLHVFFDAVGDDAKLARHMAALSESCDRFMDGADPVAWTSEWLFSEPA